MKNCILAAMLAAALCACPATARAGALDPFDNAPQPAGTLQLNLYLIQENYPDYLAGSRAYDMGYKRGRLLLRPVWYGPKLGGKLSWGFHGEMTYARISARGARSQSGLGDLVLGGFVYLYQHAGLNLSLWEYLGIPSGKFDRNQPETSPGGDMWRFEHQLALGWYRGPWGLDCNLAYAQYQESDKLRMLYSDAVVGDLALHYTINQALTVGLVGGAYVEMDDFRLGGRRIPDTRGYSYYGGLGLMYRLGDGLALSARYARDLDVENSARGDRFYFRLQWSL